MFALLDFTVMPQAPIGADVFGGYYTQNALFDRIGDSPEEVSVGYWIIATMHAFYLAPGWRLFNDYLISNSKQQSKSRRKCTCQITFWLLNHRLFLIFGFMCFATLNLHTAASQSVGKISLSNYIAADDAIVKLSWPDSSTWVNSGSTLPTYETVDSSWVFDRAKSQYFDAGPRNFNTPESGFTITARLQWNQIGFFQRVIEFGSFIHDGKSAGLQNSIILGLWGISTSLFASVVTPQIGIGYGSGDHVVFQSDISLELNTWYTLTFTYSAAAATFKVYLDGALRHTFPRPLLFVHPRQVQYTYIGKSLATSDPNFSGRVQFLAAYDRALSDSEILSQHVTLAPSQVNSNVTLTLSFSLPFDTTFKTVSVTGLRFSSNSVAAFDATCSNLDASGLVVSPSFKAPNGPLVLSLSKAAASVIASAPVVCHISGLVNAARPSSTNNSIIAVFDDWGFPVITHRSVEFPATFLASGSGSSISLSSHHAGATNVTVNITLAVAAPVVSVPFKTISVTGLRFSAFNSSAARAQCTSINSSNVDVSATMILPSGILLLRFSNGVKVDLVPVLSAFEPGFSVAPKYFSAVGSPQVSNAVPWRGYSSMFFNNPLSINSMSNNYFTAPLFLGQQMTVAAWVRSDNRDNMTALGFRTKGVYNISCFQLDFTTSGTAVVHIASVSGAWNTKIFSVSNAIPSNQFVHVAFSRALNFETKLYLNGELKSTAIGSTVLPTCDILDIGGSGSSILERPLARWEFESDLRDSIGMMHGVAFGGARVENGALILDGVGAYVKTAPLEKDVTAKTLEVWVQLDTLVQRGGAPISLQTSDGIIFDAIVFSEMITNIWIAGSNVFQRTVHEGPVESEADKMPIHFAIVYQADGTITRYRNGIPYHTSYKTGVVTFAKGGSHFLFGLRHGLTAGTNAMLSGRIFLAQFYDRALTSEALAASFKYHNVRGFNGYLQDLRVYDRVLSPGEVGSLASVIPKSLHEITCSVSGLTNADAGVATAAVSLSTFGVDGVPLQTQVGVEFPVVSQSPPIITGLIAHYNADSWMGARWTDLSGTGNHVTEIGSDTGISVARPVGAPAYLYGDNTSWMIFPIGVLPKNYTFFYVARYNSDKFANKNRIFQGYDVNAVFGFYWKNQMLLYHGSCTPTSLSLEHPIPNMDWIPVSVRSDSLRFSGKDVTQNRNNGCSGTARLALNTGYRPSDISDFAIQSVLVYNVKLSDEDVQRVEAWLQARQPTFTPADLQV